MTRFTCSKICPLKVSICVWIRSSPVYSNRGGSRTAAKSKMERFVIIVNGLQLHMLFLKTFTTITSIHHEGVPQTNHSERFQKVNKKTPLRCYFLIKWSYFLSFFQLYFLFPTIFLFTNFTIDLIQACKNIWTTIIRTIIHVNIRTKILKISAK